MQGSSGGLCPAYVIWARRCKEPKKWLFQFSRAFQLCPIVLDTATIIIWLLPMAGRVHCSQMTRATKRVVGQARLEAADALIHGTAVGQLQVRSDHVKFQNKKKWSSVKRRGLCLAVLAPVLQPAQHSYSKQAQLHADDVVVLVSRALVGTTETHRHSVGFTMSCCHSCASVRVSV